VNYYLFLENSKVTKFDEKKQTWEDICDDLGIIDESRIIWDLHEKLEAQANELEKSWLSYDKQLLINKQLTEDMKNSLDKLQSIEERIDEYSKAILYVEDKYLDIYKIAFLKINDISFTSNDLNQQFSDNANFVIRRGESASKLSWRLRAPNCDWDEEKRIVWLFDFDKEWREQFHYLNRENFWNDDIKWDKVNGFYKSRNDHDCFHSMLLPIPDRLTEFADLSWEWFMSYVEIEHLLPLVFLTKNKFVEKKNIPWWFYYKIKDDKKDKIRKAIIELWKEDFGDFKPLFASFKNLTDK